MSRHTRTAAQKAALRKAQLASARKRHRRAITRPYVSRGRRIAKTSYKVGKRVAVGATAAYGAYMLLAPEHRSTIESKAGDFVKSHKRKAKYTQTTSSVAALGDMRLRRG